VALRKVAISMGDPAGLVLGRPVLFSSVAHGSALDIAGQNRATPEAVVEAVRRLVATPRQRAA
jgi:4-hydroxy-L-threonine phosphate dehydrogenase PdxA